MNKKKYFTIVLTVLLICVAAFLGVWAARVMINPFQAGEHGDAIIPVVGRKATFLVVGTDKSGYNTDTIMVATIDQNEQKISIMSIPRDTRVTVNGSTMKINAVYSYAKNKGYNDEEMLIEAISDMTGIGINYYAIISTKAFREIVDALGGFEYEVRPEGYHYSDPYQDLYIDIPGGKQWLNGEQAEGLVRFRNDYARADLQRVEVQQDVIKELIKQKLNVSNIGKIPQVYNAVSKNVVSNIKVGDLMDFGKGIVNIDQSAIKTYTLPSTPQTIGGVSYVIPNEEEISLLVNDEF